MYFSALEDYFRYGHVDVAQVTQEFFQTIFQKMFMAMNPQYEYSEQYQRCIKAQMESVKPFGEVPEKLASSLKRSLVATRILHKSVQSAFEIVNQMSMVRISIQKLLPIFFGKNWTFFNTVFSRKSRVVFHFLI